MNVIDGYGCALGGCIGQKRGSSVSGPTPHKNALASDLIQIPTHNRVVVNRGEGCILIISRTANEAIQKGEA